MHVLVLNPSCEERVDLVGEECIAAGATVHEVCSKLVADLMVSGRPIASATVVPSLPRSSFGYDFLVVLGSPLGVKSSPADDAEGEMPPAFIAQAEALIRSFHAAGKPVLGTL